MGRLPSPNSSPSRGSCVCNSLKGSWSPRRGLKASVYREQRAARTVSLMGWRGGVHPKSEDAGEGLGREQWPRIQGSRHLSREHKMCKQVLWGDDGNPSSPRGHPQAHGTFPENWLCSVGCKTEGKGTGHHGKGRCEVSFCFLSQGKDLNVIIGWWEGTG